MVTQKFQTSIQAASGMDWFPLVYAESPVDLTKQLSKQNLKRFYNGGTLYCVLKITTLKANNSSG